jgi:sRNA-binding carbon storage regulator CsrA
MLVVSRKKNEWIRIEPIEGLDPKLTLRDVFADRPIIVKVMHVGRRVRLIIDAPPALKIWRASPAAPGESLAVAEPRVATAAAGGLPPSWSP